MVRDHLQFYLLSETVSISGVLEKNVLFLFRTSLKCPLDKVDLLYYLIFIDIIEKVEISQYGGRFTTSLLLGFAFYSYLEVILLDASLKLLYLFSKKEHLSLRYVTLYPSLIMPFALKSILFLWI